MAVSRTDPERIGQPRPIWHARGSDDRRPHPACTDEDPRTHRLERSRRSLAQQRRRPISGRLGERPTAEPTAEQVPYHHAAHSRPRLMLAEPRVRPPSAGDANARGARNLRSELGDENRRLASLLWESGPPAAVAPAGRTKVVAVSDRGRLDADAARGRRRRGAGRPPQQRQDVQGQRHVAHVVDADVHLVTVDGAARSTAITPALPTSRSSRAPPRHSRPRAQRRTTGPPGTAGPPRRSASSVWSRIAVATASPRASLRQAEQYARHRGPPTPAPPRGRAPRWHR